MDVVFPTPLTPTTKITYGLSFILKSSFFSWKIIFPISSFKITSNSWGLVYFSFATLDSIASIIFIVVFTPTSEVIRISSNSSKTSTSTFDLPTTAF